MTTQQLTAGALRRLIDGISDEAKVRLTLEGGETIAVSASAGVDASGVILLELPRPIRVPVEPRQAPERPQPRRRKG
ncbi:MAG TPA: hypothetical protein VD948_02875 [Rhodothermales bacterium]|nr:hypothetical protein [Rhodothermales bacterium]